MAGSAVIGALRVVFDADNVEFNDALDQSRAKVGVLQDAISQLTERMRDAGVKIAAIGAGFTAALTLPLTALAKTSVQTAGQFEAAMKRVGSALDSISPDQLKALETQARTLGPAVGRGATEAAGAIENLAKNGLDASNILGGGLAAALKLAAAGQADLAPAADLTTDIMQQFGKTAAKLGPVVDKVSGALLASKFGFQDYQLAVGQAGGVAGAVGVSFEDFNTALAGTSALFQSGSDAGTSFKTFLTNLSGNSKQAQKEMADLGMSFFDSSHRLKDMADVAEVLRTTLGGLSEQARTKVLTDIFGTDGMRTAIGLMKLGKDGFNDLQATIGKASADNQVAKTQEGYAAAMARLAAAFENLKISIGQSGLLDIMTGFANSLTRLVNGLANLSPFFTRIAAGFSAIAAAAGPLLVVIGGALYFAVGVFLRTLGPLGWALSAVIEPIGTLVAAVIRLGASLASMSILRGVAGAFLDLTGPIGWALAALITFKDYIIVALEQVWQSMVTRLGPPLEALFGRVQAVFAKLSGGPIGSAISGLVRLVGVLVDVLGTVLTGLLEEFGELVVRAAGIVIAAVTGIVNVFGDLVGLIGALITGDWAGAWEAAKSIVSDVFDAIVNMAVALVPDMEMPLRTVYGAAKAWLGDGLSSIYDWVATANHNLLTVFANTFPGIVATAKDVYTGVKTWLVDNFRPLMDWIGGAAKWIADRYSALKAALGLGTGAAAPAPAAPAAPTAPKPKPVPTNSYMPTEGGGGSGRKGRAGRDTSHDAENREELELQAQLQAARARGDRETEQRLQDQLDLTKQIEAYQRTGLSLTESRARAERDMRDLQVARTVQSAREIADQQRTVGIGVAKLDQNVLLENSLERQAELQQRIEFYYQRVNDLARARQLAEADQAEVDAARNRVRASWFQDDADARSVRMAQLRGDSEEEVQQLQRVIDIKKRARELEEHQVAPDDAVRQANEEADAAQQAEMQGKFRDIIRGGFQAALGGNFGDWFKNWWKDRVAKGMTDALNSLSDLIMRLFSRIGSGGSGSSGGGILGAIGSVVGAVFGKGTHAATTVSGSLGIDNSSANILSGLDNLPKFASGGSFQVGGRSGIDQNVVAFRGTLGEHINISKGDGDAGPGGLHVHYSPTFNAQGAGPREIDELRATMDRDRQQLPAKIISTLVEGKARRLVRA